MARSRLQAQLRMTPGAMVIAGVYVVASLVLMMCDPPTRATIADYVVASPSRVFERGFVWTLVTSPLVEVQFISLLLNVFVLWAFVPTLERFWGTSRFYRFAAITSVAGVLGGILTGLLTGRDVPIYGLSPLTLAALVAFGVIYARQPVQVFGVLPLTGRQAMYGFLVLYALVTVSRQEWELGGALAGASIAAAVITSKRWSPALAWKKWRIARMRRRLSVLEGGAKPARKRDEHTFLN